MTSSKDRPEQIVLLLGNVDHEGITHALQARKRQYRKKALVSSLNNWKLIVGHFQVFDVLAVVGKLTAESYTLLLSPDYAVVRRLLLKEIFSRPHVLFAFEEFVREAASSGDHDGIYNAHPKPNPEVLKAANEVLRENGINVVSYKRNADLTVMATQFLDETLEGLLFRIYVPSGRLWSGEVERLIQLFRDYLVRVGRKSVRLDQTKTDRGTSYEFRGDRDSARLSDDFRDFSGLLDLCVSDPQAAEDLLKKKDLNHKEVLELLTRYAKEAKRLQTDLKHERERAVLAIRQRLESELVDGLPGALDWKLVDALVESAVPSRLPQGPAILLGDSAQSREANLPISVNLSTQIINTVNGIVAQEIRGDAFLSSHDRELLDLIARHGGENKAELASAVRVMADEGISESGRVSSGRTLKAFLHKIGPKLGQVGLNVLQAYVERKLGVA